MSDVQWNCAPSTDPCPPHPWAVISPFHPTPPILHAEHDVLLYRIVLWPGQVTSQCFHHLLSAHILNHNSKFLWLCLLRIFFSSLTHDQDPAAWRLESLVFLWHNLQVPESSTGISPWGSLSKWLFQMASDFPALSWYSYMPTTLQALSIKLGHK